MTVDGSECLRSEELEDLRLGLDVVMMVGGATSNPVSVEVLVTTVASANLGLGLEVPEAYAASGSIRSSSPRSKSPSNDAVKGWEIGDDQVKAGADERSGTFPVKAFM
jgi:hypothetical protein